MVLHGFEPWQVDLGAHSLCLLPDLTGLDFSTVEHLALVLFYFLLLEALI